MNVLIDKKYPYNFIELLRKRFIHKVALKLLVTNFTKIDIEMNKLFQFPETTLSKEIILYALDNLEIVKLSNYYSIQFNQTINYPKTKIKLITLLKFISYGNSSVHGNSILVNEFRELNKNLYMKYKIYKLKGVVI